MADVVVFDGADVFFGFKDDVFEAFVAFATDTHLDKDFGDVTGGDAFSSEKAQDGVVVGCDLERGVKGSVGLIDFTFDIEGRVWRHPAVFKLFETIGPALPVTDDFGGVLFTDIDKITIDGVDIIDFKGVGYFTDDMLVFEKIVRV